VSKKLFRKYMPSQNNALTRWLTRSSRSLAGVGSWLRQHPVILTVLVVLVCLLVLLIGAGLWGQQIGKAQQDRNAVAEGPARPLTPFSGPLTAEEFTLAPEAVRQLDADAARLFNDAIPFSDLPVQAAKPFIMTPTDIVQYSRALDCLAAAVYYEAANETPQGQAAVAQVVLNRMRHPAYPKTVCGVVFQGQERTTGCQFSFTCDGAMDRPPSVDGWARARAVASSALNGSVARDVGMATHYHANYVAPYWAERLVKIRQIGVHIFYRWTGSWGLPFAFSREHSGEEPVILKMAAISTPLEMLDPTIDPNLVTETPVAIETRPLVLAPVHAEAEPVSTAQETAAQSEGARAEVVAAAPRPVVPSNPLLPPEQRPQRRSRIPVPSGW
jgi:hypothetical protein